MLYVQRDAAGRLLRVERSLFVPMSETLAVGHAELHTWMAMREEVHGRLAQLKCSGLEFVLVLENLVDVLVGCGVIRYIDLPEAARSKRHARAETRAQLGGLSNLMGAASVALVEPCHGDECATACALRAGPCRPGCV